MGASSITLIRGIVTVGGVTLVLYKQPAELLKRLVVIGMALLLFIPATKSHLKASITIIITFLTTGLYTSSVLILWI